MKIKFKKNLNEDYFVVIIDTFSTTFEFVVDLYFLYYLILRYKQANKTIETLNSEIFLN